MLTLTSEIEALVDRALAEDLSGGDATTEALIPEGLKGKGVVMAREVGVLAGGDVAAAVFRRVDPALRIVILEPDGTALEPETFVLEVTGAIASILTAERTAVNFMQHLSGIATETSRYVREVDGYVARVLDTRKTIPGLRALQKYAVTVGGGTNHRYNLGDGVLIKDNHIEALGRQGVGLAQVVDLARTNALHSLKIEIEVEDLEQVQEALDAGADILLLDNMPVDRMRRAVEICRGKVITEASGGIRLDNVREIAATGVDLISVGALTHSARALDFSLELVSDA
jgi:nicotinate-nucleotide pyrophosphorylase (carboxylating)